MHCVVLSIAATETCVSLFVKEFSKAAASRLLRSDLYLNWSLKLNHNGSRNHSLLTKLFN